MSYSYDRFLRPITSTDRNIQILDNTGIIKYTINPFSVVESMVSNNLLKINIKGARIITINFSTSNEAKLALPRLQQQIDTLTQKVPLVIDKDIKNYIDSVVGNTGTSGSSGSSGTSGVDGTFYGSSGSSGVNGTSGATGSNGSSGTSGISGGSYDYSNGITLTGLTVSLGGTLSQTVILNGDLNDLLFTGFDNLVFTSSVFDVVSDLISLDSNDSTQILSVNDVTINAGGQISLSGDSGLVSIGNTQGLVYQSDYKLGFVTHSLVDKGYVDFAIEGVSKYRGTSSTQIVVPEAGYVVTFTTQTNLAYTPGETIVMYDTYPNLYMVDDYVEDGVSGNIIGTVDSYNILTGSMSVVVDYSESIGSTYSYWYINLSGKTGVGLVGATGATGFSGTNGTSGTSGSSGSSGSSGKTLKLTGDDFEYNNLGPGGSRCYTSPTTYDFEPSMQVIVRNPFNNMTGNVQSYSSGIICILPEPGSSVVGGTGVGISLSGYPGLSGPSGLSGTSGTSGTSQNVAASYMRGSRSNQQTSGLTIGSLVVFNQTDNSTGSDISLNTSTGQITLAANKTYRLLAQVPTWEGNTGARPSFRWYNETTSSYVGSLSAAYNPGDAGAFGAFGGTSDVVITTTQTTVVSFRIVNGTNLSGLGGNGDFSTGGSYPWFDIEVISGYSPLVNGTSGTSGTTPTTSLSLSETLTVSGTASFNGLTVLQEVTEVINATPGATASTVVYDFSTGSNWYHSSVTTNYTANFTNIPTTNNRAITATIVMSQSSTAYMPTVVQINGSGQQVRWAGGTASGTPNQVDIVGFTFIRSGNVWAQVLGQINTFD